MPEEIFDFKRPPEAQRCCLLKDRSRQLGGGYVQMYTKSIQRRSLASYTRRGMTFRLILPSAPATVSVSIPPFGSLKLVNIAISIEQWP